MKAAMSQLWSLSTLPKKPTAPVGLLSGKDCLGKPSHLSLEVAVMGVSIHVL